jgi:hypothetical protein
VHVPSAHQSEFKVRDKVRLFIAEKKVAGSLVDQPVVCIALPEPVVEVPVLRARPDAPCNYPKQATGARSQESADGPAELEQRPRRSRHGNAHVRQLLGRDAMQLWRIGGESCARRPRFRLIVRKKSHRLGISVAGLTPQPSAFVRSAIQRPYAPILGSSRKIGNPVEV